MNQLLLLCLIISAYSSQAFLLMPKERMSVGPQMMTPSSSIEDEKCQLWRSFSSLGILLLSPLVVTANQLTVKDITVEYDGAPQSLGDRLGKKATLVVNVASYCALTPQYKELVELDKKYKNEGFQILAFPCNQFGSQEPSPVKTIRKDMAAQYNVEFPIFDKLDVNGPFEHPLYSRLKKYDGPIVGSPDIGKVSWNFEKFLLDANGTPVRRYKPGIRPDMLDKDIKSLVSTGILPPRKKASLNDF
eukprot:gene9632-20022_t